MRYLLDTHAFLWFIAADKNLSRKTKLIIEDLSNDVSLSIISLWEIAIKYKSGKLQLKVSLAEIFNEAAKSGIEILPLDTKDLITLDSLKLLHRDPFDRLLIAQAVSNDLCLVTRDENFKLYKVKTIW